MEVNIFLREKKKKKKKKPHKTKAVSPQNIEMIQ